MKTALALILVSLSAFGDDREVILVREGSITDTGGESHSISGGGYMPSSSFIASGKELAACRARDKALESSDGSTALVAVVLGLVASAMVVSYLAGANSWRASKP